MRLPSCALSASKSLKMPNKMLIDATHPEETRVVVVRGNRVEEFDFESAQRKQLRGNIYLAKVTRVEPSLQAAFIEYGGNRHGFLAFSEIHPDYYQIPVADRQALIEADERAHREAEEETEHRPSRRRHRNSRRRSSGERVQSEVIEITEGEPHAAASEHEPDTDEAERVSVAAASHDDTEAHLASEEQDSGAAPAETGSETVDAGGQPAPAPVTQPEAAPEAEAVAASDDHHAALAAAAASVPLEAQPPFAEISDQADDTSPADAHSPEGEPLAHEAGQAADIHDAEINDDTHDVNDHDQDGDDSDEAEEDEEVESVGGDDALEEVPERTFRPRRQYKIQEVIKRRQVMLVQVVKEERGNKGAALTTYLSLAGRYAVLMPNTARGGGISRKITSSQDRSRLKEVVQGLDVPEGMGVILRTAGASRTKQEIERDFEYLIRMWETVRDLTLRSQAPTLVYEEGSLIKRSLRDLYNKDIDEIQVAGEAGYREARDFMKMLMPSNVRAVKLYRDAQPLFSRMGVESQLDAMFSPVVQLKSGGYIVINQTEALVSIDVNSGRSTREHHIEDTALKTNLEAAEEVARQLRLRDLAGLIVIDFIDMDERRNNRAVERKLSDCLRQDRARIQVGRISHFGLLEMSRQRIRASMLESSTEPCPHCGGTGHIRSVSSVALQLVRNLEETLMKGATHNLVVKTRTDVALYVLNHKRALLRDLETSFKVTLSVLADPNYNGQQAFAIERGEQVHTLEAAKALLAAHTAATPALLADDTNEEDFEVEAEIETDETEGLVDDASGDGTADAREDSEGDGPRRRRRRRRRGRDARDGEAVGHADEAVAALSDADHVVRTGEDTEDTAAASSEEHDHDADADAEDAGERRPRRRGRRGGRRRRGGSGEGLAASIADELGRQPESEASEAVADFDGAPPPDETAEVSAASEQPADNHQAATASPAVPDTPAPSSIETPAPTEAADADLDSAESHETKAGKPVRRRSTVREKVSFVLGSATADTSNATPPAPAPAETNSAPAQSDETAATDSAPVVATAPDAVSGPGPRRAGWWSRRFGGN